MMNMYQGCKHLLHLNRACISQFYRMKYTICILILSFLRTNWLILQLQNSTGSISDFRALALFWNGDGNKQANKVVP
jgi:hypothetical protein